MSKLKGLETLDGSKIKAVLNELRVLEKSYEWAITLGMLTSHKSMRIFGYNPSVTGTEDISELATATIPLPTVATAMEVVSTSVNDISGGTGIEQVMIHGLLAGHVETTELVTLNGTTPVATANSYLRINYIYSKIGGSNGSAVGDVTLQTVGGATIYSKIAIGQNGSRQALYTIPINKVAYITSIEYSSSGKEVAIQPLATCGPMDHDLLPGIFIGFGMTTIKDTSTESIIDFPYKIPATADIKIIATDLAVANPTISAVFDFFIEDA